MSDSPVSWTQLFAEGRAAIDSVPLVMPMVGRPQHTYARLDRSEATEKYLGDWILALIERVERLEGEVEQLRGGRAS